jgi:sulfate transport system permease protein
MGITLTMLSLVVLLPIGALLLKGADYGPAGIWDTGEPRTGLGGAVPVVPAVAVRGAVQPGLRRAAGLGAGALSLSRPPVLDAAVDLPFALPTAVAGIALTALYAPNGAFGAAGQIGWKIAYTQWGIFIALVFVGLPFVARTVQPVVAEIDREVEEASATLGASRLHTLRHVILPMLTPAALTGFALSLARRWGNTDRSSSSPATSR